MQNYPFVSKTHKRYTDIVLNTLNPDRAVETIMPGICGCQWISLISDWPWCRNSSWGGRSLTASTLAPTSHDSTDRSHWLTMSSAPEAANTLESMGFHSTEVMGALCCLKLATGRPVYRNRRAVRCDSCSYSFSSVGFHSENILGATTEAFLWTEQLLSCFRPAWRTKGLGVHQKGDLCSCFYRCTQRCLNSSLWGKGLNMSLIRCN